MWGAWLVLPLLISQTMDAPSCAQPPRPLMPLPVLNLPEREYRFQRSSIDDVKLASARTRSKGVKSTHQSH